MDTVKANEWWGRLSKTPEAREQRTNTSVFKKRKDKIILQLWSFPQLSQHLIPYYYSSCLEFQNQVPAGGATNRASGPGNKPHSWSQTLVESAHSREPACWRKLHHNWTPPEVCGYCPWQLRALGPGQEPKDSSQNPPPSPHLSQKDACCYSHMYHSDTSDVFFSRY